VRTVGAVVHELGPDAHDAWIERGHKGRHFFPHRVIRLRKGGIDGLKLGRRMVGEHIEPAHLRQLLLHALPPHGDDLPADLFADDDIVWHQQQFGLPAHVATASLVVDGTDLFVPTIVSDIAQRIGRRPGHKTRVENRFKGWAHLIINAAIQAAADLGASRVKVATAAFAHAHTDPARDVGPALFHRVYDAAVGAPFRAEQEGDWWVLDVAANTGPMLPAARSTMPLPGGATVCVHHDIERGWGHLDIDEELAGRADREGPANLERMLQIEADAGVAATYSVVGLLFNQITPAVRAGGHALAFHSFDHADTDEPGADDQLRFCRTVDYRLKGYRPARSSLGPELIGDGLALHNFEWLASSRHSFGFAEPKLEGGVVRIPIITDDFDLYRGTAYGDWHARLFDEITSTVESDVPAVFSLHDCYGEWWLDDYPPLLDRLGQIAPFATLDQVAARELLAHSW
jgi:hypothetical protein